MSKEINEKLEEILDDVADVVFAKSQENILANSFDTGFLMRSGNVIREPGKRRIVYSSPYAAYVEFGTHPHMPPVQPLIEWSKRKLRLSEKEAESAGWAIAIKIKNEGAEPKPFLRPAANYAKVHFNGKYRITTNG